MNEELLYTQEDMDEYIRTCEELQDKIKEQEETIEQLGKRPEMVYAERVRKEVAKEIFNNLYKEMLYDSDLEDAHDVLELIKAIAKKEYGVVIEE